MWKYYILCTGGMKKSMRVNSIGYDEKYMIYSYFELTRQLVRVSNTKLGFLRPIELLA
jgi:hypothetical protein